MQKPIRDALQDLMGGTYKAIDKQVMYIPKRGVARDKVGAGLCSFIFYQITFLIDLYINSLAKNGKKWRGAQREDWSSMSQN